MKKILIFLISCICNISFAQTKSINFSPFLENANPVDVGMSEERLARIDSMCIQAIDQEQVPGIVALVARKGKIVYHKAFGLADNEQKIVMQPDAIFRIASQTKAITATAVMILWEEGKFRLDDPISKYIAEFENEQVLDTVYPDGTYRTRAAKEKITIRHLLTHTSGIGYGAIDIDPQFRKIYKDAGIIDLFTSENITIEENVKKLAGLPLHHDPGTAYVYSEGLDVLGYFIEIVSGIHLDEFFRTRIFEPMGMNDSWFYLPDLKKDKLVALQTKENNQWKRYPVTFYDPEYPIKGAKTFFSGGAGLVSTAKDYATFLQVYLNEGEINGIRYLSRTTVNFMLSNQIGDLMGRNEESYGLAFGIINKNGENSGGKGSEGTFRWGGYFNTQYFADPKENVIGIIMKQTRGISWDDTDWKFRQLVGQAIDD